MPQQKFMSVLLAERQVPDQPVRFATAHDAIDWLKSLPFAAGTPQATRPSRGSLAECGLYRHEGRLYVVREFTPQGENRKVRYARELVPTEGSQADRANGHGDAVKVKGIKAPGMQWNLAPSEAVSLEEVAALGIQFGECLLCGQAIETKESVVDRGGIGPVCITKQSRLLALRAA